MGTRNLTLVKDDNGVLKVAQYGQWDGYPEGHGVSILHFLQDQENISNLKRALINCRFFNRVKDIDEWIDKYNARCPSWDEERRQMSPDNRFPEDKQWFDLFITRDLGSGILSNLCAALKAKETMYGELNIPEEHKKHFYLYDDHEFGKDSLMCEWAYMIDFQENKFKVFQGFNTDKAQEYELFSTTQEEVDEKFDNLNCSKYYGCKLIKEFDLDKLPDEEIFLASFAENEE